MSQRQISWWSVWKIHWPQPKYCDLEKLWSSFCLLIQTAGNEHKCIDFEISKKMYLWSFFCLLITQLTSQSVNYKQIYIHPATIYVYTFKIPEMNFAETQQELCSGCSLNFCTTDVLTLISCKIAGEVFLQILNFLHVNEKWADFTFMGVENNKVKEKHVKC